MVIALVLLVAALLAIAVTTYRVHRFGQVDRARPAQAIVVLGAKVRDDGTPSMALRARVEHAVELYRRGLAPLLLFSGGVNSAGPAEALVARELARADGIPESACLVETDSHSTRENALYSARLLHPRGVREIVLVTDTFHLLRAHRLFRRAGFTAHPSPAPLAGRGWRRRELFRRIVREALAFWW